MPANPELLKQIETALVAFGTAPLLDAALGLFDTLGHLHREEGSRSRLSQIALSALEDNP